MGTNKGIVLTNDQQHVFNILLNFIDSKAQ